MKYIIGFVVILAVIFGLYSLAGEEQTTEAPSPVVTSNSETSIVNKDTNQVNNPTLPQQEAPKGTAITNNKQETMTKATFKTNQGDITIELFAEDAPNTVANFVKLASEGFYDGIKFHRVIKGFMIQGGDPLSKTEGAAWGTGGPGYQFADEIHANNKNDKYTLAMANSGPNTNGSQFFINTNDNNFLDPKHTVFGKVISGTETVDKIENTATGAADRPVESMVIESIVLE